MGLNPEQHEAVKHFTGPCVVTAVPGSGKTTVLTNRVVSLVKNHGIDPKNILCMTFTNKAANEMKERIHREIGAQSESIFINTFHGLCLAVLRKYGNLVGLKNPFSIYSETEQKDLMSKIARMQGVETSTYVVQSYCKMANDFREDIDKDIEVHLLDADLTSSGIIREYYQLIDALNSVDFSGILYKCWKVLHNDKVCNILSDRFKFIMVDESQDTNAIQYDITRRIGKHGNVFWVGDEAQAIFSWRGARPEKLSSISDDFPGVKKIKLPRNYRSTAKILESAQRLIKNNPNTDDIELISVRGDGHPVRIDDVQTQESEAELVASRIEQLRNLYSYKYSDFAVLYRTNSLSRTIEMSLRGKGIPYRILGGFSFFDRKEIKTALSYLSFYANPHDTVAFSRLISEPKRGVGQVVIGRLERICHTKKISMIEACDNIEEVQGISSTAKKAISDTVDLFKSCKKAESSGKSITEIASLLINNSGLYESMQKASEKDSKEQKRIENIDELIKGINEYQSKRPSAKIEDYLQTVQVMTSDSSTDEDDAVSLMTMHSAKGLEFQVVSIIGMHSGVMPHPMAIKEDREDEERRLMYVGVTRAKSILYITRPLIQQKIFADKYGTKNKIVKTQPSKFLFEIDPEYCPE